MVAVSYGIEQYAEKSKQNQNVLVLKENTTENSTFISSAMHNMESLNNDDIETEKDSKSSEVISSNKLVESTSRLFKSKHLKELVLLQLDLIDEQQQKISFKDKEILALKHERDQLEARVNRMERRIAIQKRHSIDNEDASKLKSPANKMLYNSHLHEKKAGKTSVKTKVVQSTPVTILSINDRDFQYNTHLRTNIEFLDDEKTKLGLSDNFNKQETFSRHVAVPIFSLVCDKNSTKEQPQEDSDSIEDISDDAYLKRHSKPEQEEKRRKRWDLQLLRQQRQQEILAQKYQNKVGKSDSPCETIYRAGDACSTDSLFKGTRSAMAIEVGNEVPVCAFGYHLPATRLRDFQLPWFSIAKKEVQLREAKQRLLKKQQQKGVRGKSSTRIDV